MHERTHASSLSPQRPYKVFLTSSLPGEARTQRGAEPAEELPEASVMDTGPIAVTSLPLNSCTQSALILNSRAISSSSFTQTFPIPTPLFSPPFLSLPCPSSQHPKSARIFAELACHLPHKTGGQFPVPPRPFTS